MAKIIYESSTTLVNRTTSDGVPVIAKILKPQATTPSAVSRYQREFDLNQSLTSPYVCQALAYDDTKQIITFEDIEGESLREHLKHTNIGFNDRVDIALELAKAVASIHEEGVIHRDINPSNVVVAQPSEPGTNWNVRLIDFGLATFSTRVSAAEIATGLTGTLPYVSPEQTGRVNREIDSRADLYSLGATLYELFVGHPPFEHKDPLELIHALARDGLEKTGHHGPMDAMGVPRPTLPQWDDIQLLTAQLATRPRSSPGQPSRW